MAPRAMTHSLSATFRGATFRRSLDDHVCAPLGDRIVLDVMRGHP